MITKPCAAARTRRDGCQRRRPPVIALRRRPVKRAMVAFMLLRHLTSPHPVKRARRFFPVHIIVPTHK